MTRPQMTVTIAAMRNATQTVVEAEHLVLHRLASCIISDIRPKQVSEFYFLGISWTNALDQKCTVASICIFWFQLSVFFFSFCFLFFLFLDVLFNWSILLEGLFLLWILVSASTVV